MAVTKETKSSILKKFRRSDLDTGSSEIQVALITARINELTEHFKTHKKDVHSQRGLIKIVNRRRKLLDYLKKTDSKKYDSLIKELDIRK
ncbi:MAG: 30S ribosomal protein S15 [Bdellovibrionales bacterium]